MIEDFKKIYENRHDYVKEWKKKNPDWKVLGYMCSYFPEEIAYAANVLPIRMLGAHEPQNVTEPHILGMFCPFCRDVLAQGLLGKYDYCDAIGITHTCKHLNQAYESLVLHKDFKHFFIATPNKMQAKQALPYYSGILGLFKKQIEEWVGKEITDADLKRGIEIVDQNRKLMREVYETRKAEDPPISGLESMYMVVSSQMTNKEEHSRIVEEVLAEIPKRRLDNGSKVRLMIMGSEDDDTEFVQMVESLDAIIVIDEHCTGTRYFFGDVEPNGNPLEAIARRYIQRAPCPTKDWPERTRTQLSLHLAKSWNVQGTILIQQKFCDPHELDFPMERSTMEENGIKTLTLEFDVTVPVGQFKIRVEAFLEMLREEDLF